MVLILMIESNVEMISRLPHVVLVVPKNKKIVSPAALAILDQSNWSNSLYCCSTFLVLAKNDNRTQNEQGKPKRTIFSKFSVFRTKWQPCL